MKRYIFLMAVLCLSISLYAGTPKSAQFRAKNHFTRHYENAENAVWVYAGNKSMYCFLQKADITFHVYYDKRGNWLYTLKSYLPIHLSKELQEIVESRYSGFKIDYVNEINSEDNEPVYTIHLQNEKWVKIIRLLSNGDDELMDSMRKQTE